VVLGDALPHASAEKRAFLKNPCTEALTSLTRLGSTIVARLEGDAVKLEAQQLRLARVLLVGVLALLAAPAVAQAAGPERAPAKGPSRLGPEPAPSAAPAPPPSVTTTSTSASSSNVTTATQSRTVVASTTPARVQQRPPTNLQPRPQAHRPPPEPRATHAVKSAVRTIAHRVEKPAAGIALGAVPTGTSESNRLLFLGGLALLFLVLGDAAFLAISARAIREDG